MNVVCVEDVVIRIRKPDHLIPTIFKDTRFKKECPALPELETSERAHFFDYVFDTRIGSYGSKTCIFCQLDYNSYRLSSEFSYIAPVSFMFLGPACGENGFLHKIGMAAQLPNVILGIVGDYIRDPGIEIGYWCNRCKAPHVRWDLLISEAGSVTSTAENLPEIIVPGISECQDGYHYDQETNSMMSFVCCMQKEFKSRVCGRDKDGRHAYVYNIECTGRLKFEDVI